ncbi:DUF2063 domain-containing protein [Rhodospirillaceae bacterium KN72]|uniref:DUF2063 domain-containing protein n=1 Tax=Pacificispira spongiicola TaxID=2729598 RepID=A0A7Y0HF49_9PROT|nr:DNA-binding domain-containing protein [Pacificispira spongiicola]NMM45425.1 DUF2063 domain-containing protein [Pacificispira spongiicola]
MTTLANLQTLFQRHLLEGDAALAPYLARGGAFLPVYRNAYGARLREIMAGEFPGVAALLGPDRFEATVDVYLADHPSTHRNARWLGRHFTDWLGATDIGRRHPVLVDMAAYEWALSFAFDAADADALPPEVFATVPPDAWPGLTFAFHPSLRLLTLGHDLVDFRKAAAEERDPDNAPTALEKTSGWAVWRDAESLTVQHRPLADDEADGLSALTDGGDFSNLCDRIADHLDASLVAARAAELLGHWVGAGWIVDLGGFTLDAHAD